MVWIKKNFNQSRISKKSKFLKNSCSLPQNTFGFRWNGSAAAPTNSVQIFIRCCFKHGFPNVLANPGWSWDVDFGPIWSLFGSSDGRTLHNGFLMI
jgi:hypothetical protein